MLREKGFTLIELLVVISVIGLLSSVVLTSLSSARLRARDAKLMQEARSLASLHLLEYADANSFSRFNQGGWRNGAGAGGAGYFTCSSATLPFVNAASAHAVQAIALCTSMTNTIGTVTNAAVHNGVNGTYWNPAQSWSVMVYLPGQNKYLCIGSSGRTSIEPVTTGTLVIPPNTVGAVNSAGGSYASIDWISPGCYGNP
jgi:prepilin-type N-terminal cleavage/methylation domain-containing protein